MVLVQDPCSGLDIELVVGADVPRQPNQPVDVGADDADLRARRGDPAHPVDLLDRPGLDLLRHPRGFDLLAELVDLGLLGVLLAELTLDRLELLAEDVLALGLVHLGLDFGLDLALQLEDLDLPREEIADELEALDDVDRLEQLLALLRAHVGAVGDHVGEQPGLRDVPGRDGRLGRNGSAVGNVLLDLRLDRAHQRLDLDAGRVRVADRLDAGQDVRAGVDEAVHAQSALALNDRPNGAVLQLDDLRDLRQCPDRVQLGRVVDVLLLGATLSHEGDGSARGHGRVERVDALVAAHLERDDHLGEDDRLPEGDERQLANAGWVRGLCLCRVGRSGCHVALLSRWSRRDHRSCLGFGPATAGGCAPLCYQMTGLMSPARRFAGRRPMVIAEVAARLSPGFLPRWSPGLCHGHRRQARLGTRSRRLPRRGPRSRGSLRRRGLRGCACPAVPPARRGS